MYSTRMNGRAERARSLASILIVSAAALAAMAPALTLGFTNFDDNLYVTQNAKIMGLTPAHLWAMLRAPHEGQYGPLTLLSFALQYHFSKLDPLPYHALNLLFHAANSALVFFLALRLSGRRAAALLTALFFAVHPVHAEPAAWVSSRKDMLVTFFYLSSVLLYLRGRRGALACFVLALLSKPVAVTLPAFLLVIEWYQGGSLRSAIKRGGAFVILAVVFTAAALLSHPSSTQGSWTPADLAERFIALWVALGLYLSKLVWPFHLSGLYPWPEPGKALAVYGTTIAAGLALIILFGYAAFRDRHWRFGALIFIAVIFPLLPFLKYSIAVAADKYIYLAAFGFFYAASHAVADAWQRRSAARPALAIAAAFLFFTLARASQERCLVWADSLTLWNNVLSQFPDSAFAHQRRADHLRSIGSFPLALADYDRAAALRPVNSYILNNRAATYMLMGDRASARRDLERALAIDPSNTAARNNLKALEV